MNAVVRTFQMLTSLQKYTGNILSDLCFIDLINFVIIIIVETYSTLWIRSPVILSHVNTFNETVGVLYIICLHIYQRVVWFPAVSLTIKIFDNIFAILYEYMICHIYDWYFDNCNRSETHTHTYRYVFINFDARPCSESIMASVAV